MLIHASCIVRALVNTNYFLSMYFRRCDADIVLKNVFRVFDQGKTKIDKIDPRDLMLAFTMAMSGSS